MFVDIRNINKGNYSIWKSKDWHSVKNLIIEDVIRAIFKNYTLISFLTKEINCRFLWMRITEQNIFRTENYSYSKFTPRMVLNKPLIIWFINTHCVICVCVCILLTRKWHHRKHPGRGSWSTFTALFWSTFAKTATVLTLRKQPSVDSQTLLSADVLEDL